MNAPAKIATKSAATAYRPAHVSPQRRMRKGYTIRLWSVRHSRLLEWVYGRFAGLFLLLHPFWKAVGYGRAEAPVNSSRSGSRACCSTAACAGAAFSPRPA